MHLFSSNIPIFSLLLEKNQLIRELVPPFLTVNNVKSMENAVNTLFQSKRLIEEVYTTTGINVKYF